MSGSGFETEVPLTEAPDYVTEFNGRLISRTDREWWYYTDVFPNLDIYEGRILDLGAGDAEFGHMINMLRQRAGLDVQAVRVDYGYSQLAPDYQGEAVAGDALHLPFPDEAFDTVVSHWMFGHLTLEECQLGLHEVFRVLKTGGNIHLAPIFEPNEEVLRRYQQFITHAPSLRSLYIKKPADFNSWTIEQQCALFSDLAPQMTYSFRSHTPEEWEAVLDRVQGQIEMWRADNRNAPQKALQLGRMATETTPA